MLAWTQSGGGLVAETGTNEELNTTAGVKFIKMRLPEFLQSSVKSVACSISAFMFLSSAQANESPLELEAGVPQSLYIAPLDDALSPGHTFDQKEAAAVILKNPDISALSHSNDWCQIPTWLAGHWHRPTTTFTNRKDELTGKENTTIRVLDSGNDSSKGTYADKSGQIWHYERNCHWSKFFRGETTHYHFLLTQKLVRSTEKECAFSDYFINFIVAKKSGKILVVDQWQSEQAMSPVSSDSVKVTGHLKKFDMHGNLVSTSESEAMLEKTAEFQPNFKRKSLDGEPLFSLFVEYLKAHGMVNCIPEAPDATEATQAQE